MQEESEKNRKEVRREMVVESCVTYPLLQSISGQVPSFSTLFNQVVGDNGFSLHITGDPEVFLPRASYTVRYAHIDRY